VALSDQVTIHTRSVISSNLVSHVGDNLVKLSQFDLNLLRALDALLTERHVTRAAAKLFITQQAASSALQRLRNHFNDPLLERHGRHLELTPQGEALVEPVRNALLAAQAALDTRPAFDPKTATGTIRIAMSDYGIFVVTPILMRYLAERAPGIRCKISALPRNGLEPLEKGELDFVVSARGSKLYGEHRASDLIKTQSIFSDDFVCVADPNCLDVDGAFAMDDYTKAQHNMVSFGPGLKSIVEMGWSAESLDLNIVAVAPSFSAQIFMLPGTPMVATVQRKLAESLAPRLNLKIFECPLDLPQLHEQLMWHARSDNSPQMTWLREQFDGIESELTSDLA